MPQDLEPVRSLGLGRLCELPMDGIRSAPPYPGIERIEARFGGDAYAMHRHDTYALGVTLDGVQRFRYRGAERASLPGNVIVLHPDEAHDGGAATPAGLRYRMLYLEPALLLQALGDRPAGLPFVATPVLQDAGLRDALLAALGRLAETLEPLFVDDLLARLADLLAQHAGRRARPVSGLAWRQAHRARDHLAENACRAVDSIELEAVTGLDRYALARHFRALFATSPHRFLVMRRLQQARRLIEAGEALADTAAATGFADQSHLTRHFKKAYGVTPGRWAALVAAGR
jgi:AraC-like DNA-binding protein